MVNIQSNHNANQPSSTLLLQISKENCPLDQVKATSAEIVKRSKHVKINQTVLQQQTTKLAKEVWDKIENEIEDGMDQVVSDAGFIESLMIAWDGENWHYNAYKTEPDLCAQYILVLSAMNFCFWPKATDVTSGELVEFEYDSLATGLRDVLLKDRHAFDADRLILVDENVLLEWFHQKALPNAAERARLLREIGAGLYYHFQGKASNLILASFKSCSNLVKLVVQYFPGFRDMSIDPLTGKQVFFFKRAQIFCADIHGCFRGQGLGEFSDIRKLTMFADYRVPQILREYKVLEYDTELSRVIDEQEMVLSGSNYEIEIRAATIQVVEQMRNMLEAKNRIRVKSIEVDWLLWQRGEKLRHELKPHHKTLTVYY